VNHRLLQVSGDTYGVHIPAKCYAGNRFSSSAYGRWSGLRHAMDERYRKRMRAPPADG